MILLIIMATCNKISIFILETVVEFKKKIPKWKKKQSSIYITYGKFYIIILILLRIRAHVFIL